MSDVVVIEVKMLVAKTLDDASVEQWVKVNLPEALSIKVLMRNPIIDE